MTMRRAALLATVIALTFASGVLAAQRLAPGWDFGGTTPRRDSPPPGPDQAIHNLDTTVADPFIASGVSIGKHVELYFSSGTGPSALNSAAPAGTPERYIDTTQFPGGTLTPGVTITEAQALNALQRIADNLATVELSVRDVITLRVFLDNAPGAATMDFAGFNRAYRQFFANVNLQTGAAIDQPRGTGPAAPPIVVNPVRPSRTVVEVAGLPVNGWLVEIEAVARFAGRR
jgi:enamine deaminase RidA (YjgF/YER057c/UK114 family)